MPTKVNPLPSLLKNWQRKISCFLFKLQKYLLLLVKKNGTQLCPSGIPHIMEKKIIEQNCLLINFSCSRSVCCATWNKWIGNNAIKRTLYKNSDDSLVVKCVFKLINWPTTIIWPYREQVARLPADASAEIPKIPRWRIQSPDQNNSDVCRQLRVP